MSTDLGIPTMPPATLAPRRKTRQIKVGKVLVGGDAPVSVQSMTTTLTSDINATLQQIAELTASGCDIVRVACPSQDRKSTRLNSSHANISYAVFCLKKTSPRPATAAFTVAPSISE